MGSLGGSVPSSLQKVVAAAIVASAFLAGCTGPPQPTPKSPSSGPDGEGTGSSGSLVEQGCREQETAHLIPIAQAASSGAYPAGFSPASVDPSGRFTALGVVGFSCASAILPQGVLGPHAWAGAFLVVDPPREKAREGALHLLLTGLVLGDADLAAAMAAWRVPGAESGRVQVDYRPEVFGEAGALRVTSPGASATVDSQAVGPPSQAALLKMRVFVLDPATRAVGATMDVDKGATQKLSGTSVANYGGRFASPMLPAPQGNPSPVASHFGFGAPFTMSFAQAS